jgi:hypothetical protein
MLPLAGILDVVVNLNKKLSVRSITTPIESAPTNWATDPLTIVDPATVTAEYVTSDVKARPCQK